MQPAIRALPLTALNDARRGVINGGADLVQTGAPLAVMLAWGLASFWIALRLFRWPKSAAKNRCEFANLHRDAVSKAAQERRPPARTQALLDR